MLQAINHFFHNQVRDIVKEAYCTGFTKGWQMAIEYQRHGNKGILVSANVDKEIEDILKKQGL